MVPLLPASFAVRARRSVLLTVPVLLAFAVAGCGHKRQSMRPVFVGPTPVPVVTPSSPTILEPSTVEPPASEPADSVQSTPALDVPAAPAETSPPRAGEPSLELNPATGNERVPTAAPGPAPGASYRDTPRSPATRLRQASLRTTVTPFVSDPDDLFLPPKADRPWKYVVVHHSASDTGSYDAIDREHRKQQGWNGCGYHFVIGNGTGSADGKIEVAQRWVNQKHGVHSRNGKTSEVNEYGIGICLVGDFDKTPPTPRQIEATRALVAYLSARYAIPTERVGTHADFASTATACPGKYFPSQAIFGSRKVALR